MAHKPIKKLTLRPTFQHIHETKRTQQANIHIREKGHYIKKIEELINGGRRVKKLIPSLLKLLLKV
jgi:hypothetical protein